MRAAARTPLGINVFTVTFERPEVSGSVITYRWSANEPVGFFRRNAFFVDYVDIAPSEDDFDALISPLLGVFSAPLKALNRPVRLVFPQAVSDQLVRLWTNHSENEVWQVEPLRNDPPYPLSQNFALKRQDVRNVGILLGGGKDSMFALATACEIFGADRVRAINYAHIPRSPRTHGVRQKTVLHAPVEEVLGVEVVHVVTDVRRSLTRLYEKHIGMPLFFALMLPIVAAHDLSVVTCSNEFTHYWVRNAADESPRFYYKRFRPEFDRYLSSGLSALTGRPVQICNPNFAVSKHVAFKIISERYPRTLKALVMCETSLSVKVHWCSNCWKCAEYAFLCLSMQTPCELDLNKFLLESMYVTNLLAVDRSGDKPIERQGGNYGWVREVRGAPVHFATLCHSLASIDEVHARERLSALAFQNLGALMDLYGNKRYPVFDGFVEGHLKQIGLPYEPELREILAAHCAPTKSDEVSFLSRNADVSLRPDAVLEVKEIHS